MSYKWLGVALLVACTDGDGDVTDTSEPDRGTEPAEELDPCERSMWGGSLTFEGSSDEVREQMRTFCDTFGGVTASQSLTVQSTDLTDLDDLACVCELGDLHIIDNPQLERVELSRLRRVGRLWLDGNERLSEVRFPELSKSGPIFISDAKVSLLDLGPVQAPLLHISSGLVDPIGDTPRHPTRIEQITVQECAKLSTLAGLPCQVGGELVAALNPQLSRATLAPCTTSLDSLQITGSLNDLSPLRDVSVTRRLMLSLSPDLATLDGLQSVNSKLVSLGLFGGANVTDGRGLGHLEHVGSLHIDELGPADGLFVLDRIPLDGVNLGGVRRARAPWLDPQISMANVRLNNLPWTDLRALSGVERVTSLSLTRMPIENLDDLADLEHIGRDLVLEHLPNLTDVSALHGITVKGELRVSDCPQLSTSAVDALKRSLDGG